ncbi:PH domain-containing protein [Aliiglaciecola sp. LCG003]|uniref:PH domain-containing protein n=1 Tax=Aliiglaciecola sp. LCG003 TaxID=3053655 RepID=UPI002572B239|nr:PH domain-containing protein [Aliiglaciecola sp. LCG003]WJG08029.1 PH domain-containing protein [Aliiglaciecola sp. LCG003]
MEFSNLAISSADLPDPIELPFEALDSRYIIAVIGSILIAALMFITVMSISRFQTIFTLHESMLQLYKPGLLVVGLVTLAVCTYQFIAIPCKKYYLREHDLHFTYGVFFKNIISQPILRIQHIEIKRGPIERLFGLAAIQVFSAGGSMHTFEIPGLSFKQAQRLRQYILQHKDIQLDG